MSDNNTTHRQVYQREELHKKLWEMANSLRNNMEGSEFKNYVLGLLFYRFLSEHEELQIKELLKDDGISFAEAYKNEDYVQPITDWMIEANGYFIEPKYLFTSCINLIELEKFDVDYLNKAINSITASTLGKKSEKLFENLFDDMDLTSSKLGRDVKSRSILIARVMKSIDTIDFELENTEIDVLGDAYEYLIGMYAATAGKKAGEFYTPQSVSKLLSLLATDGLKQTKAVCDCACGSGSLLLQVGRCVKVGHYYGNECNPTTYNLARMNMILHNIHYEQFDIRHTDTIAEGGENSSSWEEKYQVQVANPPYSQKWSASDKYMKDDRFSPYGKLAPKSYEDMAFLEHMIFHMAENDARIAVLLPHGVLFRGGAEEAIRTYIVKNLNYLDAVIGLAPNCFYGTSIPVSLLVLKNDRTQNKDNILFIDASKEYEPGKNQNSITEKNVQKILNAYKDRKDIEKFCHVASMKEIEENGYNLNITRYVDTFDEEPELDLAEIDKELKEATAERDSLMKEFEKYAKELGI